MNKTEKLIDYNEDERTDRNRNGIRDEVEPPVPDIEAGSAKLNERLRQNPGLDPTLSGGDIDARWEMAENTGDEAVAGSMPTPGQSDTEDIGRGIGITYASDEPLKAGEKERSRDQHRWELDPASSDDYIDRIRDENRRKR